MRGLEDLLDATEGVEGAAGGVWRGVCVTQQHDVGEAVEAGEAGRGGAGARGGERGGRAVRRGSAVACSRRRSVLHAPLQLGEGTSVLYCQGK